MRNYTLLAIFLFFLLSSCLKEEETPPSKTIQFQNFGLSGKIVNDITLADSHIFASTDKGLYKKEILGTDDWILSGMSEANVVASVAIDDNTLLASVVDKEQGVYKLYSSTNGGASWEVLQNDFGGENPEGINNFNYNTKTKELFAVGADVLAKSTDNGKTWALVSGAWQNFSYGLKTVEFNPRNNDIWFGGQNAIEELTLTKIDQSGEKDQWQNLIPAPSTVTSIEFHPNEDLILVGGEDGIIQSTDNGANWSKIKEDHSARFYFGLQFDHQDPNILYAASWVKEFESPQPLILSVSIDKGSTWQELKYLDTSLFGGVWSMEQYTVNGKTVLLLGLYKGGVYRVIIG